MNATNIPTIIPDHYVKVSFQHTIVAGRNFAEIIQDVKTLTGQGQLTTTGLAPAPQPGTTPPMKRQISAAARRSMAQAQKKRWEEKRAAAAAAGQPAPAAPTPRAKKTRRAPKPQTMAATN